MRSRTSTWFETKVKYQKTMEDGSEKVVSEAYVVDALSFTAGFKLAWGIAGELGAPYSFDADEEEKAKEMITNG